MQYTIEVSDNIIKITNKGKELLFSYIPIFGEGAHIKPNESVVYQTDQIQRALNTLQIYEINICSVCGLTHYTEYEEVLSTR